MKIAEYTAVQYSDILFGVQDVDNPRMMNLGKSLPVPICQFCTFPTKSGTQSQCASHFEGIQIFCRVKHIELSPFSSKLLSRMLPLKQKTTLQILMYPVEGVNIIGDLANRQLLVLPLLFIKWTKQCSNGDALSKYKKEETPAPRNTSILHLEIQISWNRIPSHDQILQNLRTDVDSG